MDNRKIYLLAELTVLPEFLDEVKAALGRLSFLPFKSPAAKHCSRPHVKTIRISSFFLRSFLLQRHTSSTLSRATRNERFQLLRASWLNRQS
jgi:hypothetical protein